LVDIPQHPFLFHVSLALTLLHDRYIFPQQQHSARLLAHHIYHGAQHLNRTISQQPGSVGFSPAVRTALWSTAGLLGGISFANFDAQSPSQAWPLRSPADDDLNWLRMTEGKRVIWKLARPLGPQFRLYGTADFSDWETPAVASASEQLKELPPSVRRLCGMEEDEEVSDGAVCGAEKNPYVPSVLFLEQTIGMPITRTSAGTLLRFFGTMEPELKPRIVQRDPAALVLLAIWFSRMTQYQLWWSRRRTCFEGAGICAYLQREYPWDADIMDAIEGPSRTFQDQVRLLGMELPPDFADRNSSGMMKALGVGF
jgi:hypothetical protein